jgi:hypothetical protein
VSRAERRRAERAAAKRPVVIASDSVVAAELGAQYEARPMTGLDAKVPGVHRWIVMAVWRVSVDVASDAFDPDRLKLMDNENLVEFSMGCWDCEQQLGPSGISVDSVCPAGDEWTPRNKS